MMYLYFAGVDPAVPLRNFPIKFHVLVPFTLLKFSESL